MATYYSDFFTSDGTSQTSLPNVRVTKASNKLCLYAADIYVKALATTSDVIRFMEIHSSARIFDMKISGDDAAAAGALNLGLHAGSGGAVIDADLFGSAIAKDAASVDALVEATTLSMFRGTPLWSMANAGAGTYTTDPDEMWDITGTPSTSFTTTAQGFRLSVIFAQAGG